MLFIQWITKQNNRFFLTCAAAVLYGIIVLPGTLSAADYTLYGEITGSGTSHHYDEDLGDQEHDVTGILEVDANHRVSLDAGEFFAHHSLSLDQKPALNHHLYEAYFGIPAGPFMFELGKQRINWGFGYMFSPTDALHPAEQEVGSHFVDDEEGFMGTAITFTPVADLSITAALRLDDLFSAEDDLAEELRYAGYVSAFIDPFDIFGSFVYQWEDVLRPGAGVSVQLLDFIISGDVAVEFYNRVDYPEEDDNVRITADTPERGEPYWAVEAALERSFYLDDITITPIVEYGYREWGYSRDETELYIDLLRTPSAMAIAELDTTPGLLIGKQYLTCSIDFVWTNRFSVNAGVLVNLLDSSTAFNGELTALFLPGIDFYVKSLWLTGDEDESEFGSYAEDVSVSSGVRVHF